MIICAREKNEKASKFVGRVLFDNIVSMNMIPGEQIKEDELSSLLNVSRTPVREAILEMAQMRLIDIYPQKGTYVSLLNTSLIDQGQYLRIALEPDLVASACELASKADLQKARDLAVLQRYYEGIDTDRVMQLDFEFHKLFYYINSKEYLYEVVERATAHLNRMRKLAKMTQPVSAALTKHEEILDAVEARDSETARRKMFEHLQFTLTEVEIAKSSFPDYFT